MTVCFIAILLDTVPACYPAPPFGISHPSARWSPRGRGDGCQMTVSPGGGGIARQSGVPSTDGRDVGHATTRVERSHDPLQ